MLLVLQRVSLKLSPVCTLSLVARTLLNSIFSAVGGKAVTVVTSVGGEAITLATSAGAVATTFAGSVFSVATEAAASAASQATHTNVAVSTYSFGFTSAHAVGFMTVLSGALVGAMITL